MAGKPFRLGVIVGRFQTIHSGHEMMIEKAVELCETVGIFVGSSQESRTYKNPFTYAEREAMLKTLFPDGVSVYPLPDIGVGNNAKWGDYVLENVRERFGTAPDLMISGKETRRTGWLDDAAGADISELYVPKTIDISATEMRENFINDDFDAWKRYTNPKLWGTYETLRSIVLESKENLDTDSI